MATSSSPRPRGGSWRGGGGVKGVLGVVGLLAGLTGGVRGGALVPMESGDPGLAAMDLPRTGFTVVAEGPVLGLHLIALTGLGLLGLAGLYRALRPGWGPPAAAEGRGMPVLEQVGADGEPVGAACPAWVGREALQARGDLVTRQMPLGCVVQDAEFRVVEWNPAAERILGFTEAELVGQELYDVVLPREDRGKAEEIRTRLRAGDPFAHGICEHVTREGRRVLCEWQDSVLRRRDGSVTGYLSMFSDITDRCRRDDAIRESEARYRRLFESMVDGFARLEVLGDGAGSLADCRFLEVNGAFERQTGIPVSRLVGRTLREVFGDIDPYFIEAFGRVALRGEATTFERRLAVLDRWFQVSAFPTGGQQLGALFADVTSRVRDREALLRKELELEAVFDQTPMIKFLVDAQGAVCRTNRAGREYFGVTDGEALPERVGALLRCRFGRDTTAECPRADECPLCSVRPSGVDVPGGAKVAGDVSDAVEVRREVRLPVERPGGGVEEAVFLMSMTPLQLGGRPLALLCLEDVTASRAVEERLREQAALLAAAHDAIYVLDLDGGVQFWNGGAERLYGWTTAEAVGQPASELVFGGSGPMWANLCRLVREEGFWDGELLQVDRRAQQLIVDVRASLVRDSQGRPKSILMVASDLTERKQLERQLMRAQRLESLGTLACGVAHDLNNVLTPVQMVGDLLRSLVPGSDAERLLDLLSRSARRGADIIRQLLLFGRGIESARAEIDLRFLAKEVAKMLRETFPKSIQVEFDLEETLGRVVGDVTQLHQVLLNLCVNARDAMMPKGGTLTLRATNLELDDRAVRTLPGATPGSYVMLEVADTGTGIPAEVLDRIFDPFFTTKPLGQGTGLGLATVQGIVRGHQGFIQVLSEVGVGSRFRVHLPVSADLAPMVIPEAPQVRFHGDQRWILVVDDEDAICALVGRALEGAGFQVITAGDGAEAISIFGRRHAEIAAVVVDMMMPFIDGSAAITMFRKIKPSVAVLAVSGLPSQRDEAEKVGGGRVVFLSKPFEVPELLSALGRAMEGATGSVEAGLSRGAPDEGRGSAMEPVVAAFPGRRSPRPGGAGGAAAAETRLSFLRGP